MRVRHDTCKLHMKLLQYKSRLKVVGDRFLEGKCQESAKHFHVCGDCGQEFDLQSLAQLIHHNAFGHKPLGEVEHGRSAFCAAQNVKPEHA